MRKTLIIFMMTSLIVISNNSILGKVTKKTTKTTEKNLPFLKEIFDKYGMTGSFTINNHLTNEYSFYNKKRAQTSYIPASTFKIPNLIIGLETGVINSESIFKWDGKERTRDEWEKDFNLRDAMQASCVPCFQELARKIGVKDMKNYLKNFKYEKMIIDSSTIDNFWLTGDSKISSIGQVEFLRRFYQDQLNLKHSTKSIVLQAIFQEGNRDYKLYGKTGWSQKDNKNMGWFVGFLEVPGNVYYFAVNLEPKNQKDLDNFVKSRKEIAKECLQKLGILKNE